MPRPQEPFAFKRRNDSKTFQFTINPASGLPRKVCQDWRRRSFQDLPDTLAQYRAPKNKPAAKSGILAFIQHLEKQLEQNEARRSFNEAVTVGEFTGYDGTGRLRLYVPVRAAQRGDCRPQAGLP